MKQLAVLVPFVGLSIPILGYVRRVVINDAQGLKIIEIIVLAQMNRDRKEVTMNNLERSIWLIVIIVFVFIAGVLI